MSTFKNRTTPGVYITELNAFPNSIPGVQTAVPAFIGYTEKALVGGKPAYLKPIVINSLAEYQEVFGKGPDNYHDFKDAVVKDPAVDNWDVAADTWDKGGSKFVQKYYTIERAVRPAPVPEGDQGADGVLPITKAGMGAFNLYNSIRLFYVNGGGTCYVCSCGSYTDGSVAYDKLKSGLDAVGEQSGPTMLVIPDAVLLGTPNTPSPLPTNADFAKLCQDMLKQCADLQDRISIFDVYGTSALNPFVHVNGSFSNDVSKLLDQFRKDVGEKHLNYGTAYFPFLNTSIISTGEITYLDFNSEKLKDILTEQAAFLFPPGGKDPATNDDPTFKAVKAYIDQMKGTDGKGADGFAPVTSLDQNLSNAVPLLEQMKAIVVAQMSMLPASGAMAGQYTFNDSTRGVWNAPANLLLSSVNAPSVTINATLQGPINVPLDGKAVNVIRDFTGRGPVVWGARTLDGNSNDWRYVQVRRTLVYVETSIKTALNQFVFAANNGTTWVAVTAMVSAFLTGLWQQGGLMGAKASDAFTVQCGLGSTMTGMDVLQGYMVVQITLQMIRPAEFIELTFKQKMEGVA